MRLTTLMVLSTSVHAQAVNPSMELDRQSQIIERQQLDRLREDQDRAQRASPTSPGSDLQKLTPQITVPSLGVQCREIREIRFVGDTHKLPNRLKQSIQKEYAGRCLGVSDFEGILGAVTKSYIDRGYITTRAYLAAQDLRTGVLEVTVVEGKIAGFEVTGGRKRALFLPGAFPVKSGDLLNLRDLEQGIDQINSLASNNAKLTLRPGDQPGESVVVVENSTTFPVHLYTSFDNAGSPSTGRNSASATVAFDSLLGMNELLAVTRRQSIFPNRWDHKSDSTAFRGVLPVGYYTISIDISRSSYANGLTLPSGTSLPFGGTVISNGLTLDRVVYRDQASRLSLSARLGRQSSRNWLGGQLLEVSSRDLSVLDLATSGFTQVGGGIVNGRLAYVQGLDAFGSMQDPVDLDPSLPHAQFRKITLDLGYSRGFEIANRAFMVSSQFSAQHAYDTLYGTQQIQVGGDYSVRGFLDSVLSGDNGFYVRNELSMPWQLSLSKVGSLSGRFYTAFDIGRVSNRALGVPSGSMSGATVGAGVQWKKLNLDFFVARPLHVPSTLMNEGTRYVFRLSAAL